MKKAQIRMFETIAVLFIFILLIGFGLVFYSRMHSQGMFDRREERYEKHAIEVAQAAVSLPELKCSSYNTVVSDCIDYLKAEAFIEAVSQNPGLKNEYYFDLFGYSRIEFREIFPGGSVFVIYDFVPEDIVSRSTFNTPMSLYYPSRRTYSLGMFTVEVYEI